MSIIRIPIEPGQPLGGRFRVANENGTGAKLTRLRSLENGRDSPLKVHRVKVGFQMLKINDVNNVCKMKFKKILQLLRSLAKEVRVIDFGHPPQQQEESPKEEDVVVKREKQTELVEITTATTPAQEEKVIEENAAPKLTIQVNSTTTTDSVLPAESDDLDEFESFLDSTCRSAASLESAVDSELIQHELLREKEIDAHIDEIMEDL